MSSDFLTHLNSAVAEFKKTVYLDELAAYPYPMQAPVYSMIPHNQSYVSDTVKWKLDLGTLDGISFESISLDSPVLEGDEASVSMKKMYQTIEFDRFSMAIMKNPRASAIDLAKKAIAKASLERAKVLESIIVGSDSTGAIGTIDTAGVVDNGGGSYTCTISAATWAYGQFRRRLMLNVGTSLDIFEITDIDDNNRKITILRRSGGTKVPAAADVLYRQRGKNNYPIGLKEIIEGTGDLHGVPRKHGWQSLKLDWTNEAISEQKLLELFLKVHARSQEYPDMLLLSPAQMVRFQALVRDSSISTREALVKRTGSSGEDNSFVIPNVNYLNLGGQSVKLLMHPDLPQGSGYFVNTNHLELVSVGPGEFVSPVSGDNNMLHMGNITGKDAYRMLWAYYYAIRTDMPGSHGGFTSAVSTLKDVSF